MQLSDLATASYVQWALIVGGLIAILSGIIGRNKKSIIDEVVMFFGFIIGILLLAMGILTITESATHATPGVATLMLIILGVAMFFRPLKKVPFAGVIGFIGALFVAIALYNMAVSNTWIIIVFLVVFVILWLIFKVIFGVVKIAAAILTFRPVLMIIGVIALIEGVLFMMGSSL